jgi:hypothetical protein
MKLDNFDNWLNRNKSENSSAGDEFAKYSKKGAAISITRDSIFWWSQEDVKQIFFSFQR